MLGRAGTATVEDLARPSSAAQQDRAGSIVVHLRPPHETSCCLASTSRKSVKPSRCHPARAGVTKRVPLFSAVLKNLGAVDFRRSCHWREGLTGDDGRNSSGREASRGRARGRQRVAREGAERLRLYSTTKCGISSVSMNLRNCRRRDLGKPRWVAGNCRPGRRQVAREVGS